MINQEKMLSNSLLRHDIFRHSNLKISHRTRIHEFYGSGYEWLDKRRKYQKFRSLQKKYYLFDTNSLDTLVSNFIKNGHRRIVESSLYKWAYMFRCISKKRFDNSFKHMRFMTFSNVEVRAQNVRQKDVFIPKCVELDRSSYLWNRILIKQFRSRLHVQSFLMNAFFELYSFFTDIRRHKLYEYLDGVQDYSREWKVYSHFKWRRF